MKRLSKSIIIFLFLIGCAPQNSAKLFPAETATNPPKNIEDIRLAAELPVFAKQINEVELADSFNDVDPTFVLGAIVNKKTGEVRSFDSFLKENSKISTTALSEVYFKNFVEDSLAANAKWLDFVDVQMKNGNKAEVTIIKAAKVNVPANAVDKDALKNFTKDIPTSQREDYAVIIGYSDYILHASLFRGSSAEGKASGYGAQIGGKWYNKFEDTSAYHRIVAVWSPLPLVFDASGSETLEEITKNAIKSGVLKTERIRSILKIDK